MAFSKNTPHQQKSLSQIFLKSEEPARFIAQALKERGVTDVLEIGPGGGVLTKELVSHGMNVTSVERDQRFVEHLAEVFQDFQGPTGSSLKVVHDDFLQFDLNQWAQSTHGPCAVVGNIPYHISSPILIKVLSASVPQLRAIMMMTQKEFAQRLAATKNSKTYGSLSVFAQLRAEVSLVQEVSRHLFNPVPKVDSAIFLATPLAIPYPPEDLAFVESVTRLAFAQRRKKLSNSLKSKLGELDINEKEFSDAPVNFGLRADAVSPDEFYRLAMWLRQGRKL